MLFLLLPVFSSFLLLFFPTVFAPGPSRENKLFIECAVRAPKGRHGPETVVSHVKMDNDRLILFGLGGNLYSGNSELSELCKEDKEFGGTSRMAPKIKQGSTIEHCANGKLTMNGKYLNLKSKKQPNYEQCFAGNYELFECPEEMCNGKSSLIFVEKRHEPKAKSYAFVYGGKMLVREVTMAEVSADQLECVKKVCAEESVPLVEEAIRWRRRNREEKKELKQDTDKFKVYKECAVKRRRVGTDGKTTGGKGMGGNLYAGESNLAAECEEDKLFTRSKVTAKRATLLGCHNSTTESGGTTRLTLRTGTDKIQMKIRKNSEARGSQCHAEQTTQGHGEQTQQQQHHLYDIYKCPKEECAGREQLLLLRRKSNNNNKGKLVSRGVLMTEEVLFADVTPNWQCVRQMCGPNVRIRTVEAVKRKMDKSAKGRGTQRTTGQRRRSVKRMGRKGNGNKREGTRVKKTQDDVEHNRERAVIGTSNSRTNEQKQQKDK